MRKVFTYSRKKPILTVKNAPSNESSKENFDSIKKSEKRSFSSDSHTKLISSIVSQSIDSSGDTPQTKRQKDIRSLLKAIDCKLKFLDFNEKADFHKFYRHKNIILAEIQNGSEKATLSDLLKLIKQDEIYGFDDWYSRKSKAFLKSSKLGEATFSEVFRFELMNGEKQVVKIIPLELEPSVECDIYPLPINIDAAIHECTVLSEVSSLKKYREGAVPSNYSGFNNSLEMCVVKGKYPQDLIAEWNKWNEKKASENNCPDRYDDENHFLIITMEDGGIDMEKFKFKNMRQIQSIINQLVYALALAEEKIQFEHRDLHLGNILIKEMNIEKFSHNNQSFDLNGIQCSIIDYSLSRMSNDRTGVSFRDLDSIEWLFEGDPNIDTQYQVYKDMRVSKGKDSWRDFQPRSNILWLAFILDRVVTKQKKSIKGPKQVYEELSGLVSRILNYKSVQELKLKDEFFSK